MAKFSQPLYADDKESIMFFLHGNTCWTRDFEEGYKIIMTYSFISYTMNSEYVMLHAQIFNRIVG